MVCSRLVVGKWELESPSSRPNPGSLLRGHARAGRAPWRPGGAPRGGASSLQSRLNPKLHTSSHSYPGFHFLFVFHLEVKFSIPDFNSKAE